MWQSLTLWHEICTRRGGALLFADLHCKGRWLSCLSAARISFPLNNMRKLRQSLLYTKEGDLDFGWIILIACCLVGLGVFTAQSIGLIAGPSVAAWAWFGSFTGCAFIAGTAISRARLLAASRLPGEMAQGIGQATERFGGPSTRWFDTDSRVSESDTNDPEA